MKVFQNANTYGVDHSSHKQNEFDWCMFCCGDGLESFKWCQENLQSLQKIHKTFAHKSWQLSINDVNIDIKLLHKKLTFQLIVLCNRTQAVEVSTVKTVSENLNRLIKPKIK